MPKGIYKRKSAEIRFWSKVNRKGPIHPELRTRCWIWNGAKFADGYGAFGALGEQRAHRISFRLFVGSVPKGSMVLHKCDNPSCVRPSHLYLGDAQANMDDKFAKGRERFAYGKQHGSWIYPESVGKRLNSQAAVEIRQKHEFGRTRISLAVEYHVTVGTIHHIINRRTWKRV